MNEQEGPTWQRLRSAYDAIADTYTAANRERDFLEAALKQLGALLPTGARVLDLGCGPGLDCARLLAQGWRAIGVDLSWEMLQIARRESAAVLVQADMRRLPFAPGFDAVLAVASLLHTPRQAWPALLSQLARLLKPGGWLYLSLKAGQGEAWVDTAYGQIAPRFFVYWQPAAVEALLADAGFGLPGDIQATSLEARGWISWLCQKRSIGNEVYD